MRETVQSEAGHLLTGLLVDDDRTFSVDASALLEERLRDRGVHIRFTQANSPEGAISIIRNSPPFDLVMTDMLFPPVGQPDAPVTTHTQRGTDIIRVARDAHARVVIGFTRVKSQRFQEWRTKCREFKASFYQRDDLIVADEDSVAGDIAEMLLRECPQDDPVSAAHAFSEVRRAKDTKAVAVVCRPNERIRRILGEFLESLGLHPLDFDHIAEAAHEESIPSPDFLTRLFREVQAVLVLLTPDKHLIGAGSSGSISGTAERQDEPGSRVLVEAGMVLATDRARTVLARLGSIAETNFLYGASLEIDDSLERRQALAERLEAAGCDMSQGDPDAWGGSFRDALAEDHE